MSEHNTDINTDTSTETGTNTATATGTGAETKPETDASTEAKSTSETKAKPKTGSAGTNTARSRSGMKFVFLAMFAALSIVLVYFIHFPILPAAPYLEYDPADVPILIAAFAFGPVWGVLLTLVVSVIQGLTVSAGSGFWGILMHFVATGAMCLTAGLIYRKFHSRKGAVISLSAGALAMIIMMIPLNLIITPIYTGMSTEAVAGMLLPVIIPFNAIKSVVNCLLTFIVYKHISRLIDKTL